MAVKSDNFLADLHKPKVKNLTYQDGLRFGLGFAVGTLFVLLIIVGIAAGLIYVLHVR